MSPNIIVWVDPPFSVNVMELLRNVSAVKAGKSGGNAKPPPRGSPVKLEILKTFVPGEPGEPGMRTSKDRRPRFTGAAGSGGASNNRSTELRRNAFELPDPIG